MPADQLAWGCDLESPWSCSPPQPQPQGRARCWGGGSGRRRAVHGVCTVGSVLSWQGQQANSTLDDKSGCCSFLNACQGPGCYARTKTTESYISPRESTGGYLLASQSPCPVPSHLDRANGCPWAPSGLTGRSPALPLPAELGVGPGRARRVQHGSAGMGTLSSVPWLPPRPQQGGRQVRPGQEQSPWLIFKEEEAH